MAHRSWCAEHPGTHEQRAAGVPRRRRARLGRRRPRLPPLRRAARGRADRRAQGRRQRPRPGRGRRGPRPRRRSSCSAGARTPPAGGRSRRSCPTRSRRCSARCTSTAARRSPTTSIERLIGPRLAATAAHLDQLDHKSRLQELVAGDGAGAAGVPHARPRAPTTPSGSSPRSSSTARSLGEGNGRSKKAAEQAAAAARRAPTLDVDAAPSAGRCLSCPRSRPSGAGSAAHVVGRRIERGRGRPGAHGAADVGAAGRSTG